MKESELKQVVVYTDGSCLDNGAPDACGGWAAILIYGEHRKEIYGAERGTKNNRMELTAAIEAAKALTTPCKITLCTDSEYVIKTFRLVGKWAKNGSERPAGHPKNMDLLTELRDVWVERRHKFSFQHIDGHSGNKENERADELARSNARALQKVQVIG